MFQSRPQRTTYLGRPAEVVVFANTKSALAGTGLRLVQRTWLDDNTVEVKVCKGDGRKPTFQVFRDVHEATPEQIAEAKALLVDLGQRLATMVKGK